MDTIERTLSVSHFSRMEKVEMAAEVAERKDAKGVWSVEAIDWANDGRIFVTLFDGPKARERAIEYAQSKYSQVSSD